MRPVRDVGEPLGPVGLLATHRGWHAAAVAGAGGALLGALLRAARATDRRERRLASLLAVVTGIELAWLLRIRPRRGV